MNHPPLGAASKKIEPHKNNPPIKNAQKPNDDSRGNGRSRDPSICGNNKIEIASKIGMANRNIITDPCNVKIWLYLSAVRKVLSGYASWIRINRARTPPNSRKKTVTAVYHFPTSLLFTSVQYRQPVGIRHASSSRASRACCTSAVGGEFGSTSGFKVGRFSCLSRFIGNPLLELGFCHYFHLK